MMVFRLSRREFFWLNLGVSSYTDYPANSHKYQHTAFSPWLDKYTDIGIQRLWGTWGVSPLAPSGSDWASRRGTEEWLMQAPDDPQEISINASISEGTEGNNIH